MSDDGRTLEIVPAECAIIAAVRELRESGLTLQAIADELNRRGYRTRSGSPWRRQYVHGLAA